MRGRKDLGVEYPPGVPDIPHDLSTNELARRLKLLAAALQDMGQEGGGVERWSGLALHLASEAFTAHQSREVRILVACALADLFRVTAQTGPPFTDPATLKDVCIFLIRQLRGLDTPDEALHQRFSYLLENLTKVKTLMVAIELDDAQEVICQLIKHLLATVNQKTDDRTGEMIIELVTPLLMHADHVSWQVLDALLLPLLDPIKTTQPKAASVAADILCKCEKELEDSIQTALTMGKQSEVELGKHVVALIGELHPIVPNVLVTVIPQLEIRLQSTVEKDRVEMVKLVTRLLGHKDSTLGAECPSLLTAYLGRFCDMKAAVRLSLVEGCMSILVRHPEYKEPILEELEKRSRDVEESVRVAMISTTVSLAKKSLNLVDRPLLEAVQARTTDKKFKVRREAVLCLATLYRKYVLKFVKEKEPAMDVSEEDVAMVASFRSRILNSHWFQGNEDKVLCEKIAWTCLVPYQMEKEKRMKALLETFVALEGPTIGRSPLTALVGIFKDQARLRHHVRDIIDLHNKEEQFPDRDASIQFFIRKLAAEFPDYHRSHEQLKEFYTCLCEEADILNGLDYILGTEYSCKNVEAKVKEMMVRCQSLESTYPHIRSTMTYVLERTAPLMIDGEAVEYLVKLVWDMVSGEEECDLEVEGNWAAAQERGLLLLAHLSSCFSHCFESPATIHRLIAITKSKLPFAEMTGVRVLLNICTEVVKSGRMETLEGQVAGIVKAAEELIYTTREPKVGKKAAQIIYLLKAHPEKREPLILLFRRIYQKLEPKVRMEDKGVSAALGTIAKIAALEPAEFAPQIKELISTRIVKKIILHPEKHSSEFDEEQWVNEDQLSHECKAKMGGMKLLARWLVGWRSCEEGYAERTFRMLRTVIDTHGDLNETGLINEAEKAYLRLTAGRQLLRLATVNVFLQYFDFHTFQNIAGLLIDPALSVCRRLANKLWQRLRGQNLPVEWLGLFGYAGLKHQESDEDHAQRAAGKSYFQDEIPKYVREVVTQRRNMVRQAPSNPKLKSWQFCKLELSLPPLLYLLSRYPQLKHHSDLRTMEECRDAIWMLLKNILLELSLPPLLYLLSRYPQLKHHSDLRTMEECRDAIWMLLKNILLELSLPPLLYLLSRYPQLKHHSDLRTMEECRNAIWMLLKNILVKDGEASNHEQVYRLFQTVKDHADSQSPDDLTQNQKLWALCDVGMMLVQYRSPSFSFMKAAQRIDITKAYPNYFVPCDQFRKTGNMTVYMHPDLLEEEKRLVAGHKAAQGLKAPRLNDTKNSKRGRKGLNSTSASNVSRVSTASANSTAKSKRALKRKASESPKKKGKPADISESEEEEEEEEILPKPKSRKSPKSPVKATQKSPAKSPAKMAQKSPKTPRLNLAPTATSTPNTAARAKLKAAKRFSSPSKASPAISSPLRASPLKSSKKTPQSPAKIPSSSKRAKKSQQEDEAPAKKSLTKSPKASSSGSSGAVASSSSSSSGGRGTRRSRDAMPPPKPNHKSQPALSRTKGTPAAKPSSSSSGTQSPPKTSSKTPEKTSARRSTRSRK